MKDEQEILRALRWVAAITAAALTLLLLTGCLPPPPGAPTEGAPVPPPVLRVCPDPVVTPAPPPVPRTVEAVLAWGERAAAASDANARALRTCRLRLDRLNGWIGDRP